MFGWLSSPWRRPTPSTSEAALRRFLHSAGIRFKDAPLCDVLLATTQFYSEQRMAGLADGPESDMLLFQYGCYDWGEGEMFQLGLVRQFNSAEDNPVSQLATNFLFAPDAELRALGAGDYWCSNPDELEKFKSLMLGSRATRAVQDRAAERREIEWHTA